MHEVDMEALGKIVGSTTAITKLNRWQRLELELRAIEFWDANYRADLNRDANDICAFNARQVRKENILQELGPEKQIPKFRRR